MGKNSHHVIQHTHKQGVTPVKKDISRSLQATQKSIIQLKRSEAVWESFPENLIACDRNKKIVRINATARKLFEVVSEAQYQGTDYQQFLKHYIRSDELPQSASSGQWLLNLVLAGETGTCLPEQTLLLHLPSGREISVSVHSFPVVDPQNDAGETVSVFRAITRRCQEILHLQHVHEAMLDLTTAIAQIPEQIDLAWPEETFLLSPPVLFVAQQLVNVIHYVLDDHRVEILAFDHPTGHIHFVAGSGFTTEQEQYWREIGGHFHSSEAVDETAFARLRANQEVVLATDRLCKFERLGKQLPFPAYPFPTYSEPETFLLIPLFLQQQWVGVLVTVKASSENSYTPQEIALVKAVTAQTMLVIKAIHCLYAQKEMQNRTRVLHEVNRLASEFLTMTSHELRTPLTGIMGNLQLAQRRLEILKSQATPGQMHEHIAHTQKPLALASQSAHLQQRMINDLIDDARIQTNALTLSLKPSDLLTLLREVVTKKQQSDMPEHTIVLEVPSTEQRVPIIADVGRIKQVLNIYLTNARAYSPAEQPVTVQLTLVDALARVSVHNEGAGISTEELEHIWERFYRSKGYAVQHELDLSFGLGLYLCKVFIERHQGNVGVQSTPGQGATFWFTLPMTASPGE